MQQMTVLQLIVVVGFCLNLIELLTDNVVSEKQARIRLFVSRIAIACWIIACGILAFTKGI